MKINIFLWFFWGWVLISGCKQHEGIKKSESSTKIEDLPKDLKIVLGFGGGFSGRWEGFTIYRNGNIEQWNGRWEEDKTVLLDEKLSKEELLNIWKRVDALDFFKSELKETGNLTSVLKITAGNLENRVTWVSGVEGIDLPQHEIEKFYWNIYKELNRKVQ